MNELELTTMGHTWILDLDGTIVKHNGYEIDSKDTFLEGAEEFLKNIHKKDMIVFLTSRKEKYRECTENFLKDNNIRYDYIIFGAPYGERILINDDKPSGLHMSRSVNKMRDTALELIIKENPNI